SAPGSLMLLGEHAVLHGYRSMVCAINRRITVRLTPSGDNIVRIISTLGKYQSPIDNLVDHPSFRFVLQAVRQYEDAVSTGFELQIESEFSADIGFGSSAAVTVSVHAALFRWIMGAVPDQEELFFRSLETIKAVQGRGSGADISASVFGGVVGYSTDPEFYPLELSAPLTAVYCGYKTPTPEVILKVEQLRAEDPEKYACIYKEIDLLVMKAVEALNRQDLSTFGSIMSRNHELMDQMGVNTPELQEIVSALDASPDLFGSKISGAGLGDCVIGLGHAELSNLDYPVYHLEITPVGCIFHE
ncbi:MAG TPA: galactokinase family protein, partial [Pontiella sp.]